MSFARGFLATDRPVLALDLETTGTDPRRDRIVEIALVQVYSDGAVADFDARVNPGCPIPPEATAVHGIADADVADALPFSAYAPTIADQLRGHDLVGFNIRRFDLPFLVAEFRRAGVEPDLEDVRVIDALEIFHALEPRDLAAAMRRFCGREHEGAHGAVADAAASLDVLEAMIGARPDLPRTLDGLHDRFSPLDLAGDFVPGPSGPAFRSGKYAGRPLAAVAREEPGYLRWMLARSPLPDSRGLILDAIEAAGVR